MNKFVYQCNNTYHHFIDKKPTNADYSATIQKLMTNSKDLKFKVNDRVRITKYKNIFSEVYTKNWSKKIFIIDSVLKTNLWSYEFEDLNLEKRKESFP